MCRMLRPFTQSGGPGTWATRLPESSMLLGEGHGMGSWEEEGMGGRAAKHSQNLDVSYTLFFPEVCGEFDQMCRIIAGNCRTIKYID